MYFVQGRFTDVSMKTVNKQAILHRFVTTHAGDLLQSLFSAIFAAHVIIFTFALCLYLLSLGLLRMAYCWVFAVIVPPLQDRLILSMPAAQGSPFGRCNIEGSTF